MLAPQSARSPLSNAVSELCCAQPCYSDVASEEAIPATEAYVTFMGTICTVQCTPVYDLSNDVIHLHAAPGTPLALAQAVDPVF